MNITGREWQKYHSVRPDGIVQGSSGFTDYYKLSDGTLLSFYISYDTHRHVYYAAFGIILPGSINPQKRVFIGKNQFSLQINVTSNKTAVSVFPASYWGLTCEQVLNDVDRYVDVCRTNSVTASDLCTMLIYCNGWEIPDYYPVKF